MKSLVIRMRVKLTDPQKSKYSDYSIIEAINEAMRYLHEVIETYYDKKRLILTIPVNVDLKDTDVISWPKPFIDLIMDWALVSLTSDYASLAQYQSVWNNKAFRLLARYLDPEKPYVAKDSFDFSKEDEE